MFPLAFKDVNDAKLLADFRELISRYRLAQGIRNSG